MSGVDLDDFAVPAVAVLERELGPQQGHVTDEHLHAANVDGSLQRVLDGLRATPGGSDLAYSLSSRVQEMPR